MTLVDLLVIKDSLYRQAIELSRGKSHDYADHTDVLLNFRRGAAMFEIPVTQVIATRLADKVSRLHQLSSGKKACVPEKLEDTIADAHNYLDLWYAAILEALPNKELVL